MTTTNLAKDHFIKAAQYIDKNGVPSKRGVQKNGWAVFVNGKQYPPKYIVSVAKYLSGDAREICSGKGFITSDARLVLDKFGFKPIEVSNSK